MLLERSITSTAPIAVFGGNECTDIPAGAYACDHTLTALPSVDNYTKHAVIPTTDRDGEPQRATSCGYWPPPTAPW